MEVQMQVQMQVQIEVQIEVQVQVQVQVDLMGKYPMVSILAHWLAWLAVEAVSGQGQEAGLGAQASRLRISLFSLISDRNQRKLRIYFFLFFRSVW